MKAVCPVTSQAVVLLNVLRFSAEGSPILETRCSGGDHCGRVASHCMRLVSAGALTFPRSREPGRGFLVLTELRASFAVSVLGPRGTAAHELLEQLATEACDVIEGRKPLVLHPDTPEAT